jgi:two-component system response regulator FlrC
VIWSGERPRGPHVYVQPADTSSALLEGGALRLAVAPADQAYAGRLIRAFAAPPGRPAAEAPASLDLLALAGRVAASEVSVLIEGATGTGKEGLASLIHTLSRRRDKSLVAVNCAALPEAMLEATLFGHERGAFTGAHAAAPGLFRAADGGTLLLDEVAELPLALQAKLLRVLQEREVLSVGATRARPVNVRVIAAGNRDLAAEVAAGRFRADLYYRLAVFPLRTLPLAERPQDIAAIAADWLLRRAREHGGAVPLLTPEALARLEAHDWPGNVRELGNVLDRAMVLADGPCIDAGVLQFDALPEAVPVAVVPVAQPLSGVVRAQEDRAIRRAVAEAPSRRAAAARLGISERTLRYKLAGMAARAGTGLPAGARLQ